MDDAQHSLQRDDHELTGRLILDTSHHIGLHRLLSVMRRFGLRYPAVQLDLRFMDSEDAYSGIKDGALELAIVTLAPMDDHRFVVTPLWCDRLLFVASNETPIRHCQSLSLQILSEHNAVLPNPLTFTRSLVMDQFNRAYLAPRATMATHDLEALKMMVSVGLGWSLLPIDHSRQQHHRTRRRQPAHRALARRAAPPQPHAIGNGSADAETA